MVLQVKIIDNDKKKFISQLVIDTEFFHCVPVCSMYQSSYDVKPMAQSERWAHYCAIDKLGAYLRITCNFKGLSEEKNPASLYNDDLSNEPYFDRIHLARQWLKCKSFSRIFSENVRTCPTGVRRRYSGVTTVLPAALSGAVAAAGPPLHAASAPTTGTRRQTGIQSHDILPLKFLLNQDPVRFWSLDPGWVKNQDPGWIFWTLWTGFRIRIDLMRIRIRIRIQHFF